MKSLTFCSLFAATLFAELLLQTGHATAAMVTYADLASWSANVSGITTETIPDPSPNTFVDFGQGDASHSYGSLMFSQSTSVNDQDSFLSLYNIGPLASGVPAVISAQNSSPGSTPEAVNILIEFSGPVHGFALNFGTFLGYDVTFTLSNGNSFTQSSTASDYTLLDFVGVTDDVAFTSVLLQSTELEAVLNINNISFATTFAPVPEPSTMVLAGMGGLGLALAAHRRRARLAA
ncbi:PEP-CTERM sorting domain-containing protein [Schlesneria sp.]|uniref:PEP-CTERM sorting domain-containing protein n=1 Tax=Schlesneria sp. TaxID=2762018 RepID=UPI002EF263D0